MRILKTIILVLVPAMIGFAIGLFFADALTNASDSSINSLSILLTLGYYAYLCPKVGYRTYDCLFLLIPIYQIFFMLRIAYRAAYLPNKDWT